MFDLGHTFTIGNPQSTIEARLESLRTGLNPRLVARLPSGWVELAPFQFRQGYCLLLARLGDAVRAATGAVRCNYSIYGNLDPFLHAHVVPRFLDEPEDERTLPPLSLPLAVRENPAIAFDAARDGELVKRIRRELGKLGDEGVRG